MRVPHLFFSTDVEQQTLHRRITPTVQQRDQQQVRWRDVRDYVAGDLQERTGLPVSSWLQGSYKFGTQIRPVKGGEFDIDLGIYLEWPGAAETGPFAPAQVKSLIQASLIRYAAEAGDDVLGVDDPPKERCARIRFSESFHIDVPGYHLERPQDHRDLATETHGWEESDPKALFLWFRDQFAEEDSNQIRRLIRYFKAWALLNLGEPPSSILLTVLIAEEYRELSAASCETDDLAIQHLAHGISERFACDTAVLNPVNQDENLNRLSEEHCQSFIQGLHDLAAIADAALAANSESGAAVEWSRAFQHFFPAPREANSVEAGHALVPVAFDPIVFVEARPTTGNGYFSDTNRIGPIPKKCEITFTLQNAADLPAGATVRWIVRNEGQEAEFTNDLGHGAGGGLQATEQSAYRGTHYMDVAVISAYGTMLGYRRIPVKISGLPMPVRNPKRPGWTRFRVR